jgi:hypothetical protein
MVKIYKPMKKHFNSPLRKKESVLSYSRDISARDSTNKGCGETFYENKYKYFICGNKYNEVIWLCPKCEVEE